MEDWPEVVGAGTGNESWGCVGSLAASAIDETGVDGSSCSTEAVGRADGSLWTGVAAMFVFGCSSSRVSWVTGVVSVVEYICGEISGCGCTMGVGGGVANNGLVSLDTLAM